MSETVKTDLDVARKTILNERMRNAYKRAEELSVGYTNRLNEYLNTYFSNFSEVVSENEFAYAVLNKQWRAYCRKVNVAQKYVTLRANAFEVEVARIVKEDVKFQQTKS
jgi:hypothetical protein